MTVILAQKQTAFLFYNWMYCRVGKGKSISLVQSSICLISTSPRLLSSALRGVGGWGAGPGWWRGGRLFSNYAVWKNHAGDISKSDLLSRRCGAQRSVVDRTGWAAAISPAVLVTAASAATNTSRDCFYSHRHRQLMCRPNPCFFKWLNAVWMLWEIKLWYANAAVSSTDILILHCQPLPKTLIMHKSP